jgi:hypothetical protein
MRWSRPVGFQRAFALCVLICVMTWALSAGQALAQVGFRVDRIVGGLNHPLYATHAPGDANALYIVQQRLADTGAGLTTGNILRYDMTAGTTTTFMELAGLDTDSQGGLHSLAFHPDYVPGVAGSKLYVVALRPSGQNLISTSHLEEYVLNGAGVPTYNRTLLQVVGRMVDDATHAMDWIGFKPGATGAERNWLYVSNGDGGIQCCGGGYANNSQNLNSLYGKVLRLGVGGGDDNPDPLRNYEYTPTIYHNDNEAAPPTAAGPTLPEVLYSGFRNPWRASFDRATGDFWLGDVGRSSWEEINYVEDAVIGRDATGDPAAPGSGAAFGIDFGWSRREGFAQVQGALDPDGTGIRPNSVNPLVAFSHGAGPDQHISITGGYVYRGPDQRAAIQGKYFWNDAYSNRTYVATLDELGALQYQNITPQLTASLAGTGFATNRIVSFAEDFAGRIYMIDFGNPGTQAPTEETGWTGARAHFGTGEIFLISYVPEPSTLTLVALASMCWAMARRRLAFFGR